MEQFDERNLKQNTIKVGELKLIKEFRRTKNKNIKYMRGHKYIQP